MTATFREATASDVDMVLVLMREFYASEHLPFDERSAHAGVEQTFANPPPSTIYLVNAAGRVEGYFVVAWNFSLEFGGRYAWIDELYVREGHRGRGIGAAVLEFVDATCRRKGLRAVRLEVQADNARARDWYLRSGYADARRSLLTKWISR